MAEVRPSAPSGPVGRSRQDELRVQQLMATGQVEEARRVATGTVGNILRTISGRGESRELHQALQRMALVAVEALRSGDQVPEGKKRAALESLGLPLDDRLFDGPRQVRELHAAHFLDVAAEASYALGEHYRGDLLRNDAKLAVEGVREAMDALPPTQRTQVQAALIDYDNGHERVNDPGDPAAYWGTTHDIDAMPGRDRNCSIVAPHAFASEVGYAVRAPAKTAHAEDTHVAAAYEWAYGVAERTVSTVDELEQQLWKSGPDSMALVDFSCFFQNGGTGGHVTFVRNVDARLFVRDAQENVTEPIREYFANRYAVVGDIGIWVVRDAERGHLDVNEGQRAREVGAALEMLAASGEKDPERLRQLLGAPPRSVCDAVEAEVGRMRKDPAAAEALQNAAALAQTLENGSFQGGRSTSVNGGESKVRFVAVSDSDAARPFVTLNERTDQLTVVARVSGGWAHLDPSSAQCVDFSVDPPGEAIQLQSIGRASMPATRPAGGLHIN